VFKESALELMLGNVFTNYLNQKKSMPKTFPGDTKFRQNT